VATIRVHLPGDSIDRSFEILCGGGLVHEVGRLLKAEGVRRAVVVSDSAVACSHGAAVTAGITAAGIVTHELTIPAGEASKSIGMLGRLWDDLAGLAVDRGTHVVAVGGGVVGDLTGFAAATFARGLPVWQVPTTLVAQVDSAIGGKTGINLAGGKNLVGAFWQPRGVVADIDTLGTLPEREYRSGLAEVVKYGMILDPDFFRWLEQEAPSLLARNSAALAHAVERSARLKAGVVEQDEREVSGQRAALNYGHTFAHAYETATGYGRLLHGEAVAIGMARAARLAASLGRIDADVVERQDHLLERLGLPVSPAGLDLPVEALDPDRLVEIMRRDKKAAGGRLRFVLPSRIGHVDLVAGVDLPLVRQILAAS